MAAEKIVFLKDKKDRLDTKDKKVIKFLYFLLLLLAGQLLWSFFLRNVVPLFMKTEVVSTTFYDQYFEGRGIFVYGEKVSISPYTGTLTWLKEEGARVAVAEPVAKIVRPGADDIIIPSPAAGILCYQTDGLEGIVRLEPDWKLEKDAFQALDPLPKAFTSGDEVIKGAPLFKIIDNHCWGMIMYLKEEEATLIKTKGNTYLSFSFKPGLYPVQSLLKEELPDGQVKVVFLLSRDVGDFFLRRWEDVRVVYDREKKISIPAAAVLTSDGKSGVYRLVRSTVTFQEVVPLKEVEDGRLLVDGLDPGTEIITNPFFFREGQRI
ncbi:MAG TPA: hypothetical protein GX697_06695 [Firmicutes bacterium]|nr:hypothetical protein [Bacillota bacterium]